MENLYFEIKKPLYRFLEKHGDTRLTELQKHYIKLAEDYTYVHVIVPLKGSVDSARGKIAELIALGESIEKENIKIIDKNKEKTNPQK